MVKVKGGMGRDTAGGGRVGEWLFTSLSKHGSGRGTQRSAFEWVAELVAWTTALRTDRAKWRVVRGRMNRLTKAAHRYEVATKGSDALILRRVTDDRQRDTAAAAEHRTADLKNRIDASVSRIPRGVKELLMVVVFFSELAFYYYAFSADLEQNASFVERAMVMVLAAFVPTVGLALGYWFGAQTQAVRAVWLKLATKNGDVYAAWLFSAVCMVAACVATYMLVIWRYTGSEVPGLASFHPPAAVMGTMFVLALCVVAGLKAFAEPPTSHSDKHLRRSIKAGDKQARKVIAQHEKALAAWQKSWNDLQVQLLCLLDHVEEALGGADLQVQRARALDNAGRIDEAVRAGDGAKALAAESVTVGQGRLNLPHLSAPLRIISAGLEHLETHKPPKEVPAIESYASASEPSSDQDSGADQDATVRMHQIDTVEPLTNGVARPERVDTAKS